VSLVNWRIANADQSTQRYFAAGTVISAHSFLVRFRSQLDMDLSRGPVSLLDANGNVMDSVSAPQLVPDQSYARLPDGSNTWITAASPTLNSPNVLPPDPTATPDLQATVFAIQTQVAQPLPSPPAFPELDDGTIEDANDPPASRRPRASRAPQAFQSLAIADIRGLPDETPVTTSGVVTMPTGLWDTSRAYIQANGAGILVHSFGGGALRLGDTLTIKGRVHHLRGEIEIAAIKNGEQVSSGGGLPAALPIVPAGVGAGTEALLVQISGRLEGIEREYATITDDMGSARVFLYSRLNFGAGALKAGANVSVVGVVNAAESSAANAPLGTFAQRSVASTHRLVPRLVGDILVDGVPQTAPAPSNRETPSERSPAARGSQGRLAIQPAVRATDSAAPIGASPGDTPFAFATPFLSSRQGAPAAGSASSPAPVLVLTGVTSGSPPLWLWLALGIGLGLLAGGGVAAIVTPKLLAKRAPLAEEPAEELTKGEPS
jgi:hypothetical protein